MASHPEELNDRCSAGSTSGVYEHVSQQQDGFALFQQLDLAEKQKQSLLNTLARIAHFATGPCSMTTGSRLACIANECKAVIDGIGGIGKTTNVFDAAPDLLEAVEAMLEEYEEGRSVQPFEVREMCRKARAKAHGTTYP